MTADMITFRSRRAKQDLQHAFGNVSEKINELIERELKNGEPVDWRNILLRKRPTVPDEAYDRCLQPE
jgi:hypothetical protein